MSVFFIFAMIFQDVQHMDDSRSWHSTFQHLNIKAKSTAGSQKVGKSAENRNYNRYRDVVPYDHSLVRLRNSDTEYINANFVKVASIRKEYILTQGPLANTCKHFWEMVWEQNTYSVVMLNRVVEKNQLKCHQYWPLEGSLTAGDIKVTVVEEDDHTEFIVRVLELEHLKEKSKRSIRHFHYVAWPDFGVPSSPQAFLKYLLTVQEYQSSVQDVGPPVIHCSAGIGRSGTFALIDSALTEIQQKDNMMDYDVKSKLLEMRTYRPGLIQTTEQLHFSYIAILEGANMVAPSAYSNAYYSMTGESAEEYEEEEEYVDRADKRRADGEQDDQPGGKEPRKEPIAAVTESESESESGEDDQVGLSDVNAHLNDSSEVGDESSEQPGDESDEAGEDNGEAGDESEEPGDDGNEEGEDDNSGQVQEPTVNDNAQSENLGFPAITVTATSSETLADRLEEQVDNIEEDKGGTVDQAQHKYSAIAEPHSSIVDADHHVTGTGGDGIETQATDESETISGNSDSQSEQCKHNSDDTIKYPVTESQGDFETADDCKGQTPGQSSVCSGHFSSDFEIKSSEDVISAGPGSRDVAGSSQSVEKVVDRWQCSDNEEGTDSKEPRPKRSAIRRNSLEGGKRKSVTFVPTVNGEADVEDTMERESAGYVDEKETESSHVRRRAVEERKRNLASKVDEIKKKMQNSEESEDSLSSTMIGFVLCVAVVGFAYFYYYY
ncbi:tyrosine- phosphatase non-receptor type 2-like [Paramuricea clavata]|uniref:protein-tyrosine-phosphatase n=2 Tax=Paramuricea clavata TaxID=317549 RepID=A0A7D9D903_PARCT|nr:tyrosine- phosphatase non-receptor type 2-like [Paramuricea clavata]